MNIIEMTRNLGVEIQNSAEYKKMIEARKLNDEDQALNEKIGAFNLKKIEVQTEAQKEEPNQEVIEQKNNELREIYNEIMGNENMIAFNKSSEEINSLMSKINIILTSAINGEDPLTCDTEPKQSGCSGDCGGCSGCN